MNKHKSPTLQKIETVFKDVGGFTWEQAEAWAGFCDSVGMEASPFLKVMLNDVCDVKFTRGRESLPCNVNKPQLWVLCRGGRTCFKLLEP